MSSLSSTTLAVIFSARLLTGQDTPNQHHNHEKHPSAQMPPGATMIDGSQNPEKIANVTAVRLFLLGIAESPQASPAQLARMNAKLAGLGLSLQDRNIAGGLVKAFYARWLKSKEVINAAKLESIQTRTDNSARIVETYDRSCADAMATYEQLLTQLSPLGASLLREHVNVRVKPKIKIIQTPIMVKN